MNANREGSRWLQRAAVIHGFLRRLIVTSDESAHSSIFLEVVLLLGHLGLSPKPMGKECSWRNWTLGQLDVIWVMHGSARPRAWSRCALVFVSSHNGSLLLDCINEARNAIGCVAHEEAALIAAEQKGLVRRRDDGIYEVPPPPEEVRIPDWPRCSGGPSLHRSQLKVYERCVELGELHYSGMAASAALKPRCYPLILGPTGVGKTHVGRAVAKALGAHFLPVTYGRWVPNGGKGLATMLAILGALEEHERLVLFYDEIDKLGGRVDCSWTRSVFNETFYALDGEFPMDEFRRYKRSSDKSAKTENPDVKRLFVIGCGTWQSITKPNATKPGIGFGPTRVDTPSQSTLVTRVRAAEGMPEELLARFHCEPLVLGYPEPDEIPELLRGYGMDQLAARAGVNLSEVKIDFSVGGMRVLEALSADWLLKIQRMKRKQQEAQKNE